MEELAAQLRSAVNTAIPALRAIAEEAASVAPPKGGWTRKQILGHLIDSAANNHQRFVRLQFETDLRLPGYQQDNWVNSQHYGERSWDDLVTLWTAYNFHLAHIVAHIDASTLGNGWHGPEGYLTLEEIAVDYPVHMRHHLEEILA
jgi:hypothetical protein